MAILIIDDDAELCELVAEYLEGEGFEVESVHDGVTGVERCLIVGLEMGADDYIPKPFNPRELAARIRAILRRSSAAEEPGEPDMLEAGDLTMDFGARAVHSAGAEIELTGAEFAVLETLLRCAGTVVSRDDLSRQALGRRASAFDRSLDVHLSNLRRKLGPLPDGGERIKTVRGVGYLYVKRSGTASP